MRTVGSLIDKIATLEHELVANKGYIKGLEQRVKVLTAEQSAREDASALGDERIRALGWELEGARAEIVGLTQRSNAWFAVAAVLKEVAPGWTAQPFNGMECAVCAIRAMGAGEGEKTSVGNKLEEIEVRWNSMDVSAVVPQEDVDWLISEVKRLTNERDDFKAQAAALRKAGVKGG